MSASTVGDVGGDVRYVEVQGAHDVHASLRMGSGALHLGGGAEHLMKARFSYVHQDWRPEVLYEVREGTGHLDVRQPDLLGTLLHSPDYHWDLQLSDSIPLDVALKLGSGQADLDLRTLQIRKLRAALGSGRCRADLRGDHSHLQHVSVKSGSGLNELVFDGLYEQLEEVAIANASGENDLRLTGGFPELRRVKLNSASGRIDLQLNGTMPQLDSTTINTASSDVDVVLQLVTAGDLSLIVNCVSGVTCVRYQRSTPISARFTAVTGRVEAPDFRREGGVWRNSACEAAEACIHVTVSSVSGKLILQPLD